MPEVAILTRVTDGRESDLRGFLRELGKRCPFAGLNTHFARLVVIDLGGQHFRSPQLLFSSRFDGEEEDYFAALADIREAREVWGHCEKPKRKPVTAEALCEHLLDARDRVPPSYVVSALAPSTTVAQINAALELRAELSRFAVSAQDLDPVALSHAFRQLRVVRRLART